MNKTVNINLAGIFFHIDEDAYLKLQRYLEAIKRSFTDSQGRSEIIADIEARIAELFTERIKHDKQVISNKEVDEIITIMGQPEDYLVDDEIFGDQPTQKTKINSSKKLFRDTGNSYIGGVASGLGHYLGIDAIWVRLLWILFAFGSGGTFIFIYILFWILVPEAVTTADKLTMTGEPVNISNIEKKIKDGFENVSQTVSDTVKNVDFQKHGNKIKSSSKTFFDTIGDIIMFFLKLFAKFIGLLLVVFGALGIFSLVIGLLSFGSSSIFNPWWMDYPDVVNTSGVPIWMWSLSIFLSVGIPFFIILYLGLKILINNLKSIGKIAKFTLLGLWIMSIIALITFGVKQATDFALETSTVTKHELPLNTSDTISIKMAGSDIERSNSHSNSNNMHRNDGFSIKYNANNEKVLFSKNVRLTVRSTKDAVPYMEVVKESKGKNYIEAKERAGKIDYMFNIENNQLLLDNFLITDYENKFRDQNVEVIVYLPEGVIFELHDTTKSFLNYYKSSNNIVSYSDANHALKVLEDKAECLDCPAEDESNFKIKVDTKNITIDENGIEIKGDSSKLQINSSGFKANSESVKYRIDKDGIEITSD